LEDIMARKHGRNGRLYADFSANGGAAATPVASLRQWSLEATTERVDATCFGDSTRVSLAGLPDASGSFAGLYDDESASAYSAAIDNGINNARRFYIYPDLSSTSKYFAGTAFFDASYSGAVDGAIELSGNWSAATPVFSVGIN
jgi:hypothetical protein